MAETVFGVGLKLGGAGTRGWVVRVPGVVRGKWPGGAGARGFEVRAPGGLRFGRKIWGKSKIRRISWWEGWGLLGRG